MVHVMMSVPGIMCKTCTLIIAIATYNYVVACMLKVALRSVFRSTWP